MDYLSSKLYFHRIEVTQYSTKYRTHVVMYATNMSNWRDKKNCESCVGLRGLGQAQALLSMSLAINCKLVESYATSHKNVSHYYVIR